MHGSLHYHQAEGYVFGEPSLGKRMKKYIAFCQCYKTRELAHKLLAYLLHPHPMCTAQLLRVLEQAMQARDPRSLCFINFVVNLLLIIMNSLGVYLFIVCLPCWSPNHSTIFITRIPRSQHRACLWQTVDKYLLNEINCWKLEEIMNDYGAGCPISTQM